MYAVVGRREANESCNNAAETESTGDGENCGKHHLRTHGRKGDIPKFLPTVLDTVDSACFVKVFINNLETCDKGKEAGTQRGPQCYYDDEGEDGIGILYLIFFPSFVKPRPKRSQRSP